MLCFPLHLDTAAEMGLTEDISMKPHTLLCSTRLTAWFSSPITLSLVLSALTLLAFSAHLKHSKVFGLFKILLQGPCKSGPFLSFWFQLKCPPRLHLREAFCNHRGHGSPQPQSTSGPPPMVLSSQH